MEWVQGNDKSCFAFWKLESDEIPPRWWKVGRGGIGAFGEGWLPSWSLITHASQHSFRRTMFFAVVVVHKLRAAIRSCCSGGATSHPSLFNDIHLGGIGMRFSFTVHQWEKFIYLWKFTLIHPNSYWGPSNCASIYLCSSLPLIHPTRCYLRAIQLCIYLLMFFIATSSSN
jgi:hypothetical protein